MDELPVEASVDEFVNAVLKETSERVVCPACDHASWATYDATPLTLDASNLRPGIPAEDATIGFHVVPFSCTRCGFVRFHAVPLSFPPEDDGE
jgi:hypothetical protein